MNDACNYANHVNMYAGNDEHIDFHGLTIITTTNILIHDVLIVMF